VDKTGYLSVFHRTLKIPYRVESYRTSTMVETCETGPRCCGLHVLPTHGLHQYALNRLSSHMSENFNRRTLLPRLLGLRLQWSLFFFHF